MKKNFIQKIFLPIFWIHAILTFFCTEKKTFEKKKFANDILRQHKKREKVVEEILKKKRGNDLPIETKKTFIAHKEDFHEAKKTTSNVFLKRLIIGLLVITTGCFIFIKVYKNHK